MLRIDLGCGTNKQSGFVGVDRYPLPGVDAIVDMNGLLPFRDSSVDLLFASHSLEHVKDLPATMKEVYRISKHGAQLCIVAPYSEQKLNLANPYHLCLFNEHTPRFWTDYPSAPIDPEEYRHPHAPEWGLSRSDHSNPGIDIRLVRLEYFYFPRYVDLPESEQRRLRQERMDVCDQIMYHLIVWKGDGQSPAKSFDEYAAELQPYEPEYIPHLRNRGREMLLEKSSVELEQAHVAIASLEGALQSREVEAASAAAQSKRVLSAAMAELEEARATVARLEVALQSRAVDATLAAAQSKRVEELTADLERHQTLLQELRLDHHQQRSSLCAALEESLDSRNRLLEAKASLVAAKAELLQLTEARVKAVQDRDNAFSKGASLAEELAALRQAHAGERDESERELVSLRKSLSERQTSEALLIGQLTAAREAAAVEAEVSGRLRQELAGAKEETRETRAQMALLSEELTRLHRHCAGQAEVAGRMTTELHDIAAHNRILRDEAAKAERELEFARADLRREAAAAAASQEEASSLERQIRDLETNLESNDVLRAKLGLTRAELETTAALLGLERQKEEALASELAAARLEAAAAGRETAAAAQEAERWKTFWGGARRSLSALCAEASAPARAPMARVGGFLIGRESQARGLPGHLVPLRQYSDRQFGAARACVTLSSDLSEAPYREYVIPFDLDRLTAVSVAIRPLLPGSAGIAGVEVVSAGSEIVAHVRLRLGAIDGDGITEFQLPAPVAGLKRNWLLRVFVKDADAPVAVYELARGGLLRGATQFFPLVLFR